jgi:drug/metabolite transporter (DMT)-like permease
MRGAALGVLASLLSAAAALIVARTGAQGVDPLWLLAAQYAVGALMAPPARRPSAPLRLHFLRLMAGLWAFGGYYLALGARGTRPSEISMLINTAPVLATFWTTRSRNARGGALIAFAGVAAALSGRAQAGGLQAAHAVALSAALAYAVSIVTLGKLSARGESPATTNAVYNWSAAAFVAAALLLRRPGGPASWAWVLAAGAIAAARIQILTIAAVDPAESARVSVLANLAFVWLALADAAKAGAGDPGHWGALAVVICGVLVASVKRGSARQRFVEAVEEFGALIKGRNRHPLVPAMLPVVVDRNEHSGHAVGRNARGSGVASVAGAGIHERNDRHAGPQFAGRRV